MLILCCASRGSCCLKEALGSISKLTPSVLIPNNYNHQDWSSIFLECTVYVTNEDQRGERHYSLDPRTFKKASHNVPAHRPLGGTTHCYLGTLFPLEKSFLHCSVTEMTHSFIYKTWNTLVRKRRTSVLVACPCFSR